MRVGYLMIGFGASDLDGKLERMERFAGEVRPIVHLT
jgi:hypothetical protein